MTAKRPAVEASYASAVESVVTETYRADWGRLLSLLVTHTRRLDLAEDALSEAFVRASSRWHDAGIPQNPSGWLYTTARRHIVGALRHEAMRGRKAPLVATAEAWTPRTFADDVDDLDDERLALILLCCHPALRPEARSPLALRLVIGTSTAEIARLFLVPTPTMAARITRAKKKIVTAGIPLALPVNDALDLRLDDVCRTVYLAFTAGYTPGEGPNLLRSDLAGEAVELAALLHHLVPQAQQVTALYGLLLMQHARREARAHQGQLVTLPDQDRSLWHHDEIQQGLRLVEHVVPTNRYADELRLQALIAAEHAGAAHASQTDWASIANHYGQLESLTGSAIVRLNRAVAVAEADEPAAGLELLVGLDAVLPTNHRLHAVRAELARRTGDRRAARAAYATAIRLCTNEIEKAHLLAQQDRLDE